jgi:hypothetical protein
VTPVDHAAIVLRPSKTKAILLLLVCAAFAVGGGFMIADGQGAKGWFVALFFGLGVAVSVVQLLPGASYLEMTRDGFVICSLFRRSPLFLWRDVSAFTVARLPPHGKQMVVFSSANDAAKPLGKVNRAMLGASGGLPDTYGMNADALAELMNRRRSGIIV